jgi:hypothetical protein
VPGGEVRGRAASQGMVLLRRRGETLASFVDEWWSLYAEPNLERSTLRVYATSGIATPAPGSAISGSAS